MLTPFAKFLLGLIVWAGAIAGIAGVFTALFPIEFWTAVVAQLPWAVATFVEEVFG